MKRETKNFIKAIAIAAIESAFMVFLIGFCFLNPTRDFQERRNKEIKENIAELTFFVDGKVTFLEENELDPFFDHYYTTYKPEEKIVLFDK